MRRNAKARLLRDNIVITDNLTIELAAAGKDDVTEVRDGFECGITLSYCDIKEGDIIESFELVEKARSEYELREGERAAWLTPPGRADWPSESTRSWQRRSSTRSRTRAWPG